MDNMHKWQKRNLMIHLIEETNSYYYKACAILPDGLMLYQYHWFKARSIPMSPLVPTFHLDRVEMVVPTGVCITKVVLILATKDGNRHGLTNIIRGPMATSSIIL